MDTVKRHPFSYTLGPGPYKFVGAGQIHFSDTFGARYVGPQCESGAGTCAHCGMAIIYIYVVETAEGRRFGVGSDCIGKVHAEGEFSNLTAFERAVRLLKRKQGQERRERQRLAKAAVISSLIETNASALKGLPHPSKFHQTKTAYDYCTFIYRNGHLTLGSAKLLQAKLDEWLKISQKG